jgi:hypothetical protein
MRPDKRSIIHAGNRWVAFIQARVVKKQKPAKVLDFNKTADKAVSRSHAQKEAKARNLKQRLSTACQSAESKSKAAERLKKLFKHPKK